VRDASAARVAVAAALALGAGVTWNIANVGPVATPLADAYGVSLATVGLFTTALFVTHLAAQVPAGRAADRLGARRVGLAALAAVVLGNLLALAAPDPALALVARAVVGLGSGAGFVAGADYMRSASPSAFLQGLYGAATLAGGGLAIAVVPQLEPSFGWRAPYWSAVAVAVLTLLVLAGSRHDVRTGAKGGVVADRRLVRLAVVHAATFGLSVVAANWVVTLLERHGHERAHAAPLGALVLLAGVLTRPLGGEILRRRPERSRLVMAVGVGGGAAGVAALALPLPLGLLGVAALGVGLAAGLPFAAVFTAAQRTRPDAPGAAIAFVNAWAVAAVVAGTPLLGLAFALPGEGRLGFAALAAVWAAALLVLPCREAACPRGGPVEGGREAACPRSGPGEGVWGNREVPPGEARGDGSDPAEPA
jgi:MFS family permease